MLLCCLAVLSAAVYSLLKSATWPSQEIRLSQKSRECMDSKWIMSTKPLGLKSLQWLLSSHRTGQLKIFLCSCPSHLQWPQQSFWGVLNTCPSGPGKLAESHQGTAHKLSCSTTWPLCCLSICMTLPVPVHVVKYLLKLDNNKAIFFPWLKKNIYIYLHISMLQTCLSARLQQ